MSLSAITRSRLEAAVNTSNAMAAKNNAVAATLQSPMPPVPPNVSAIDSSKAAAFTQEASAWSEISSAIQQALSEDQLH